MTRQLIKGWDSLWNHIYIVARRNGHCDLRWQESVQSLNVLRDTFLLLGQRVVTSNKRRSGILIRLRFAPLTSPSSLSLDAQLKLKYESACVTLRASERTFSGPKCAAAAAADLFRV